MSPIRHRSGRGCRCARIGANLSDLVERIVIESARTSRLGQTARQLATQLLQALELAEDRGVRASLRRVVAGAREQVEQSARDEVRRRLTELVNESGLTAAEFAARLGTSPSRLSTYLSGKVVPSAALVVRAERVSPRVTGA